MKHSVVLADDLGTTLQLDQETGLVEVNLESLAERFKRQPVEDMSIAADAFTDIKEFRRYSTTTLNRPTNYGTIYAISSDGVLVPANNRYVILIAYSTAGRMYYSYSNNGGAFSQWVTVTVSTDLTNLQVTTLKVGGGPKIGQYFFEGTIAAYNDTQRKSWNVRPYLPGTTTMIDFNNIVSVDVLAKKLVTASSTKDVYEFLPLGNDRSNTSLAVNDGWYLHDTYGLMVTVATNSPLHNLLKGGFTLCTLINYKV